MRCGRDVQQLDLCYLDSPLSLEKPERRSGVLAGDRAPDAPILGTAGQSTRLFNLFKGSHWTLIGYEVERLFSAIAPRAGLHIHAVGPRGDIADNGGHIRDGHTVCTQGDGVHAQVSRAGADGPGTNMRPPVECPKCRTVNEPSTTECDCGYNFVTKGWTRSKMLPGVDDSARREMAAVEDIARTYQRLVYIMIASPAVGALIRGLMWLSRGHDTATLLAMFVSIVLLLISLDMLLRTVYRLADGIGVTPVLYAVGSLIPVVGFLMLLSLCAEARDWTKRQGLVIGLLGPTAVSLEAFRARFGAPAGIRNETFARSLAPARARSRA